MVQVTFSFRTNPGRSLACTSHGARLPGISTVSVSLNTFSATPFVSVIAAYVTELLNFYVTTRRAYVMLYSGEEIEFTFYCCEGD